MHFGSLYLAALFPGLAWALTALEVPALNVTSAAAELMAAVPRLLTKEKNKTTFKDVAGVEEAEVNRVPVTLKRLEPVALAEEGAEAVLALG